MLRERNEHHENINSEIPVAEELDADTGNASISALPVNISTSFN